MFILDIILEPALLCMIIFGVAVVHFFLFAIPFFRRKLPKKYIYYFNVILFFVLLLMLILSSSISIYEYIPDDPSTPYIYDGYAKGIFTFYAYSYLTEACTGCYSTEVHLVPLILNLVGIFAPLILIGFIPTVRQWIQKSILIYFQKPGLSVLLTILAMILSFLIFWDNFLNYETFTLF